MVTLMNEEESNLWIAERAERIKLLCCICLNSGWLHNDEYVTHENMNSYMFLPDCNNELHATCLLCIKKSIELTHGSSQDEGFQCIYPHSLTRCQFTFQQKDLQEFFSAHNFTRNVYTAKVQCSSCLKNTVSIP